ncbi:uncharacterized protein V3H82_021797 isoform 2-T2 [Fundulus diaphanus]
MEFYASLRFYEEAAWWEIGIFARLLRRLFTLSRHALTKCLFSFFRKQQQQQKESFSPPSAVLQQTASSFCTGNYPSAMEFKMSASGTRQPAKAQKATDIDSHDFMSATERAVLVD